MQAFVASRVMEEIKIRVRVQRYEYGVVISTVGKRDPE